MGACHLTNSFHSNCGLDTTFCVHNLQLDFLAKDTLLLRQVCFTTEWCAEVGPATHLCGPLGISRTVNLNYATNSPGHGKNKKNPQQIIHSKGAASSGVEFQEPLICCRPNLILGKDKDW